jgi:hypothetical protein
LPIDKHVQEVARLVFVSKWHSTPSLSEARAMNHLRVVACVAPRVHCHCAFAFRAMLIPESREPYLYRVCWKLYAFYGQIERSVRFC